MSEVRQWTPGAYPDLDFDTYAAIPAINSGVVKWGMTSMRHMKAAVDGRLSSKDTDDRKFGRAIHCRLLEPERYRSEFLIATKCVAPVAAQKGALCGNSAKLISPIPRHQEDQLAQVDHCLKAAGWNLRDESESGSRYYRRNESHLRVSDHPPNESTKAWMDRVRCNPIDIGPTENVIAQLTPFVDGVTFKPLQFWYCGIKGHAPHGAYPPTDFIDEDQAARNEAIAAALHDHPAMTLFRRVGWSELSCVWVANGLLRKCRIDRYSAEPKPIIIDVKKMQVGAGSRADCEKAIHNLGYYRQAAGNVEAIEYLHGVTPDYVWVFIEDNEPFDVQIIPADKQTIDIGRWENNDIIGRFAAAEQRNDFHGYIYDSKFIRWGGLPIWYREQCARLGIGTGDQPAGETNGQPAQPEYAEF